MFQMNRPSVVSLLFFCITKHPATFNRFWWRWRLRYLLKPMNQRRGRRPQRRKSALTKMWHWNQSEKCPRPRTNVTAWLHHLHTFTNRSHQSADLWRPLVVVMAAMFTRVFCACAAQAEGKSRPIFCLMSTALLVTEIQQVPPALALTLNTF